MYVIPLFTAVQLEPKLVLRNTKKDEIWVNAIPLPNSNVGIKEAQSTSSILDTILDNPNPILEEDYNS